MFLIYATHGEYDEVSWHPLFLLAESCGQNEAEEAVKILEKISASYAEAQKNYLEQEKSFLADWDAKNPEPKAQEPNIGKKPVMPPSPYPPGLNRKEKREHPCHSIWLQTVETVTAAIKEWQLKYNVLKEEAMRPLFDHTQKRREAIEKFKKENWKFISPKEFYVSRFNQYSNYCNGNYSFSYTTVNYL